MLPSFSLLVPRSYKLFAIHKCLFPTPPTPHFTLPPSITNLIQCTSQIRKNMQSTKSTLFIYLCALLKFCSKNQKGSLQRKPFKQRKKQTPLEAGCSLTLQNGGNHNTIYDQRAEKEAGLPTYLNRDSEEHELEWELLQTRTRTPTPTRTGTGANSNLNMNKNGNFKRTNNLSDEEEMEKEFLLLNAWRENGFSGFQYL